MNELSHATHADACDERLCAFVNVSCHTRMSESCPVYEWVMSHYTCRCMQSKAMSCGLFTRPTPNAGVLQRVAACCSVLRCIAVYCRVLPCLAVRRLLVGCPTVWRRPIGCLMLQVIFRRRPLIIGLFCGNWPMKIRHPMTLRHPVSLSTTQDKGMLQRVAACCSVLQRVAACCSMLRRIACIAVCCNVALTCGLSYLWAPLKIKACCSVVQRVAVCCSVLHRAAVRCSVFWYGSVCVAACCSVRQYLALLFDWFVPWVFHEHHPKCSCVAVCCSVLRVLHCVTRCHTVLQCATLCYSVLQCVAVCCSVLQCDAVCRSKLRCAAVCCSVFPTWWSPLA